MQKSTNLKQRLGVPRSAKIAMIAGILLPTVMLFLPPTSFAQGAAAKKIKNSAESQSPTKQILTEVVVTGSRVTTSKENAITPVTTLGADFIKAQAAMDISSVVNDIPAMAGSMTPASRAIQVSNGTGGVASPSLLGLGSNRTLVLLDGHRTVQSDFTGETDIENFPQQLVRRVDVVTGGASAAYGSDAVAGVVNFILDKNFTGLKGGFSGGMTTYGDNGNWKAELTDGFGFGGGRGHVLLSTEFYNNYGITGNATGAPLRPWQDQVPGIVANPNFTPTNGLPAYIVAPDATLTTRTVGGLITSGPLKGIAFGPGGQPYPFEYGVVSGKQGQFMSGGNTSQANSLGMDSLYPEISRRNVFARISYDITDHLQAHIQFMRSEAKATAFSNPILYLGSLSADNAYLPASVSAAAQNLGVTSFGYGAVLAQIGAGTDRTLYDYSFGLNGTFELFNSRWHWNSYYSHQTMNVFAAAINDYNKQHLINSVDAVVNPNTGGIVCRETITNPSSGCIPYNIVGTNVATQAALKYVFGTAWNHQLYGLDDVEANVSGAPFSDWAGRVHMAMGFEYRKDDVTSSVDSGSLIKEHFINMTPLIGGVDVNEGYFETNIPLLRNARMARSLLLNGAIRETSYSTSGLVRTWKVGFVWKPIRDITVRLARSQDIRAPSLFELYSRGQTTVIPLYDPTTGTEDTRVTTLTEGNQQLNPEVAETITGGITLRPRFMPGFSASADYYDIKINDAIGTVPAQTIVDECASGMTAFCSGIVRGPVPGSSVPQLTTVYVTPFNFASEHAEGMQFEGDYRKRLASIDPRWHGTLAVRVMATHYIEDILSNGITPPVNLVGFNSFDIGTPSSGNEPNWRYFATVAYNTDEYSLSATMRGVSSGLLDSQGVLSYLFTQCSANCPAPTSTVSTINNAHVPGAVYFDASVTLYPQSVPGNPQVFFAVDNIANKAPGYIPHEEPGYYEPTNPALYDVVGRTVRAGVRFRF